MWLVYMRNNNLLHVKRKSAGMTQQQLADAVGCGKAKISKLESGAQAMTLDWALRLSPHINNASPIELLGLEAYFNDAEILTLARLL